MEKNMTIIEELLKECPIKKASKFRYRVEATKKEDLNQVISIVNDLSKKVVNLKF